METKTKENEYNVCVGYVKRHWRRNDEDGDLSVTTCFGADDVEM